MQGPTGESTVVRKEEGQAQTGAVSSPFLFSSLALAGLVGVLAVAATAEPAMAMHAGGPQAQFDLAEQGEVRSGRIHSHVVEACMWYLLSRVLPNLLSFTLWTPF